MKVGIIGLSELGITNVALLANFGYEIIAYDSNAFCVSLLSKGIKRFKDERIKKIIDNHRDTIQYTTNILDLTGIEVIIIAIELEEINGKYNLNSFYLTIDEIKKFFHWKTTLIIKTPLPVGSCQIIDKYLNRNSNNFSIAYIPTCCINNNYYDDIFMPTKLVVGTSTSLAHITVRLLYEKFLMQEVLLYFVSFEEAELYRVANNYLEVLITSYITNMHCLFNDFNLNFNNLISKIQLPNIGKFVNKGNGNKLICEYNNLKFFLKKDVNLNKSLVEGNQYLAKQIVEQLPKDALTIGILGISDAFEDVSIMAIEIISQILTSLNSTVYIYDKTNEENFKKLIGPNKKIKYVLDEKNLLKKTNIILILHKKESYKELNEEFYLKYGQDNLVIYDFDEVYKYSNWSSVKLIKVNNQSNLKYEEPSIYEKAPQ